MYSKQLCKLTKQKTKLKNFITNVFDNSLYKLPNNMYLANKSQFVKFKKKNFSYWFYS